MADRINYNNAEQALQEYLDSCYTVSHSSATVNGYKNAITGKTNGFRKFLKERHDCDEIELCIRIKSNEFDVYKILKNYVIFLDKAGLMPNSIKQFFHAIKGYLIHLGIEVYSEKCKQYVKLPEILRKRKEAITKEILVRIMSVVSFKLRVVFLVVISSGMRMGEIGGLRLSDIDFASTPTKIRIRARYEFVGYVCRKCKVVYLINYKSFKLKIQDMRLYEEFCVPRNPEISKEEFLGLDSISSSIKKKEIEEQIIMTMKVKDIPKLRQLLQKHKNKTNGGMPIQH